MCSCNKYVEICHYCTSTSKNRPYILTEFIYCTTFMALFFISKENQAYGMIMSVHICCPFPNN